MPRLLLMLLLAAALLAGCGGDDDEESAATTPAATATAEATAEATEEATPDDSASGGKAEVTPLGTKLKVGETAVIDYTDASTQAKSIIEFTPKEIVEGSMDDFKNVDLDEEQKAARPFYATIEVKNVGKGDLTGGDPATYVNGVDDRGQDQNEIIFFGEFEACGRDTPKSLKPGESYEACLVYLIPGGGSLKGFHWIQFDEKSGESDLFWE